MKACSSIHDKSFGVGSFSFPLALLGVVFSFSQINGITLGSILNSTIPASIISLTLFCVAFFIGKRFKNNLLAKSGRVMSIIFSLLIITASITTFLFN